jgi:hypothetical protein
MAGYRQESGHSDGRQLGANASAWVQGVDMSGSVGVLVAFNATAHDYDTERRKLIPHFDLLYNAP